MALIEIKNASMGYEGKIVLSDINLKINEGDYVCIVGENGSGKTTLMKCLLGLFRILEIAQHDVFSLYGQFANVPLRNGDIMLVHNLQIDVR